MSVTIELPPDLERQLRAAGGASLEEQTREALAIKFYSEAKLSIGQVAALLGIGVLEAEAWLAQRHVSLPMTASDLETEIQSISVSQ